MLLTERFGAESNLTNIESMIQLHIYSVAMTITKLYLLTRAEINEQLQAEFGQKVILNQAHQTETGSSLSVIIKVLALFIVSEA